MSRDREREAIANVDCPHCGARKGERCVDPSGQVLGRQRVMAHSERRQAWRAARPTDPLDADIIMRDVAHGPPGARTANNLLLAPMTARGRAALPQGLTEIPVEDSRRTLARLRQQGLVVMREDQ